jgi:hypothetical protein
MVARFNISGLPLGAVGGVNGALNAGCLIGVPELDGRDFVFVVDRGGTPLLKEGEDIDGGDVRSGVLRSDP